jgi:hypothetical protein
MSLDVYLKTEPKRVKCTCECGNKHTRMQSEELYWANITHNLTKMADKAGIYYALWRPEEKGWKTAKDIIPILEKGLVKLKAKREYFEKFNAENGWGTYEQFVPLVQQYLEACINNPKGIIEISR